MEGDADVRTMTETRAYEGRHFGGRLRAFFGRRVLAWRHPLLAVAWTRWVLLVSGVLLAGAWIATAAVPILPGEAAIVVHYTTTFGVDALGSYRDLLRFPVVGTTLVAFNVILATLLGPEGAEGAPRAAAQFLVAAALVLSIFICTGAFLLLRANLALA